MPFSGASRHRFSPPHVARDAAGAPHATLGIREIPPGAPGLLHRVEAGDTLETLAFRYLGASEEWWRIADVNPPGLAFGLTPGATVAIPGETAAASFVRTRPF